MRNRLAVVVAVLATACCGVPFAMADTKSGVAVLKELAAQDINKSALKISLGDKIKVDCTYYIIPDFPGNKKAISVQANLKNTAAKEMHCGYYVAFFDKDKNLIATSSLNTKIKAGGETGIGNVLFVPLDQLKKITSYQVTILEDEKEFGK